MFSEVASVAFYRVFLIIADAASVGSDKTAIEDAAWQSLIVVRLDRLEVADRNACLL